MYEKIQSKIKMANHILKAIIKSYIENGIADNPIPRPEKKATLLHIEMKNDPAGITSIAFAQISSVCFMLSGTCELFWISSFKVFLPNYMWLECL